MPAPITPNWTVKQTLDAYPDAISVLIQLKTGCVGCWMERFCTLEDVSKSYGFAVENIINSLQNLVTSSCAKK